MKRTQNIALITIGYNHYAFEDAQSALELMALMSKAVQVDDSTYSLRDHEQPCTHFLAEDTSMPELKFIAAYKFNPSETVKEFKERADREKADRADMDQKFREAPAALAVPEPVLADGDDDTRFF